jgi:hypothetical protein
MAAEDTSSKPDEKVRKGEVLPPDAGEDSAGDQRPAVYAKILAQLNNYTDRPDLFLETIEKYDPGFIKRINGEAEKFSKKSRDSRFKFGKVQSYFALGVSVVAALAILYAVIEVIHSKQANFWTIIGLALFYAITQGGTRGFLTIIDGVQNIVSKFRDKD